MMKLYATFDEYGGIYALTIRSDKAEAEALYRAEIDGSMERIGNDGGLCFGSFEIAVPNMHSVEATPDQDVVYIEGFRAPKENAQ